MWLRMLAVAEVAEVFCLYDDVEEEIETERGREGQTEGKKKKRRDAEEFSHLDSKD